MIDYIIISKVIKGKVYQNLCSALCTQYRNGTFSCPASKAYGFHSIKLWRIVPANGKNRTTIAGTINAEIQQGSPFLINDTLDVPAVISTLDEILKGYAIEDDIWRIAGMGITAYIPVQYPDLYMDFIRRSYPSPNYKLNHTQEWELNGLPASILSELSDDDLLSRGGIRVEKFESKALRVLFSPSGDNICMRINVKSEGFEKIPRDIGDKRNLSSYAGKTADIVDYFIRKYISVITGTGDYYTVAAAEDKIDSLPDISHKEKAKYLSALKAIQKYKSIEGFLHHAEAGEIKEIKNLRAAERCLQDLDRHGINVLSLSVRKAPEGVNMVENLRKSAK